MTTVKRNLSPARVVQEPFRIPSADWEEQRNAWQGLKQRLASITQVIEDAQYAEVPSWHYDTTPTTSSTITFTKSLSNTILPAVPLLYVQDDIPYYARLKSISGGTWTIQGAPMDTASEIQYLGVGYSTSMVQWDITIPVAYGFVGDLVTPNTGRILHWNLPKARLVAFSVIHETDATISQPSVNVKVDGNLVSTESGNNGPSVSTSLGWNSDVAINTTNYVVEPESLIDIACTVAGNDGSAANLTVTLLFAYEKRALTDVFQLLARFE